MGAFQDWHDALSVVDRALFASAQAKIADAMRGVPGGMSFEEIGLSGDELRVYTSKPKPKRIPGGEMGGPIIPPTTLKGLFPVSRYPKAVLVDSERVRGSFEVLESPSGRPVGFFADRADAAFYLLAVRGELVQQAGELVREYADVIHDYCERHGTYYRVEDGQRCEHCAEDAAQACEMASAREDHERDVGGECG